MGWLRQKFEGNLMLPRLELVAREDIHCEALDPAAAGLLAGGARELVAVLAVILLGRG